MTKKQKEFAALAPPFDKPTQADRIAGATKGKNKKQYNNGQRQSAMYGHAIRKPMMMGGLANQNRTMGSASPKQTDAMGMMTQQKKFGMGYNLGGAIAKFEGRQKKALGGKNAKPDYLDFDKDGDKTESMKKALKDKKGKGKA